uniref:Uncharacterized protein n=1 Tax=Schizophyllum commune (strain H4-8 / FGSC 9210) TaxID=578458 RepID=D8QKP7_SCHCM
MRERPERYGTAILPLLRSTNEQALSYEALAAARTYPEKLSTTTDGAPYAVSEYERIMYYHAQGATAPALLYRSDLLERPYPLPPSPPPPRRPSPFAKRRTAMHALWNGNKDLRAMWDKVGERGIRWETINLYFYNEGEGESKEQGEDGVTSRPVIEIHVRPGGATAAQAHTASEEILTLLKGSGVPRGEVTVEWPEGHVRMWGSRQNYVELRR